MFFCFDKMKDQAETVALTCPKISPNQSLPKCCQAGEKLESKDFGSNYECKQADDKSWKIPINGHLYDSAQLWDQKVLVNDNRSKVSQFLNPFLLLLELYLY